MELVSRALALIGDQPALAREVARLRVAKTPRRQARWGGADALAESLSAAGRTEA